MRRIALQILLLASFSFGAFGYYQPQAIASKAVTTDHSNFPVLFYKTNADFKDVGHGGKLQSSSCYDLIPHTTSSLSTRLDFELEYCDAVNGTVAIWIRFGTLHNAATDSFYIGMGDAGITTNQSTNATWNSNFVSVYHTATMVTTTADATSNANAGTITGATATTGKIDGGAAFAGGTDVVTQASLPISGTGNWTLSCWAKFTNFTTQRSLIVGGNTTSNKGYFLRADASAHVSFSLSGSGGPVGSATLSTGTWYHITTTNSSGTVQNYLNGVADGSSASKSPNIATGTVPPTFGNDPFSLPMIGSMDEVRISNSARSSGWIKTEYDNQSDTSWVQSGATVTVSATVRRARRMF